MCQTSPICNGCSLMRMPLIKTCPSGMCPASRTWVRCLLVRVPSTRTCLSGMSPASPICSGCLLTRNPSSRHYVVWRGLTLWPIKPTCSANRPGRYRRQCVVCGSIRILFITGAFIFHPHMSAQLHLEPHIYARPHPRPTPAYPHTHIDSADGIYQRWHYYWGNNIYHHW